MKHICLIYLWAISLYALDSAFHTLIANLEAFSKDTIKNKIQHLHNPFEQNHTQETLDLFAIINGKDLINEQWLHIGEYIQDYKIIDIQPEHIVLQKGKTRYSLAIGKSMSQNKETE